MEILSRLAAGCQQCDVVMLPRTLGKFVDRTDYHFDEFIRTAIEITQQVDRVLRAVEEALRLMKTQAVELAPEPAAPVRYRRPGGRN